MQSGQNLEKKDKEEVLENDLAKTYEIKLPYVPLQVDLKDLDPENFKLFSEKKIQEIKKKFTQDKRYSKQETGEKYSLIIEGGRLFAVYYGKEHALGRGTFGEVKLIENLDQDEWIGYKVVKDGLDKALTEFKNLIQAEEAIKINDKAIGFQRFSPSKKKDQFYILMKLAKGVDLFTYIIGDTLEDGMKLPGILLLEMIEKVIEAAIKLHGLRILHRDLKLENTHYYSSDELIKIVDFGLSALMNEKNEFNHMTACGSPLYLSPELFDNLGEEGFIFKFNQKTEGFSLGVIMAAILNFVYDSDPQSPFSRPRLWNIASDEFKQNKRIHTEKVKKTMYSIVEQLMRKNQDSRLDLETALSEVKKQKFNLNEQDRTIKTLIIDVNEAEQLFSKERFRENLKNYHKVYLIDTQHTKNMFHYLAIKQLLERKRMAVHGGVICGNSAKECVELIGKNMLAEKHRRIYECTVLGLKLAKNTKGQPFYLMTKQFTQVFDQTKQLRPTFSPKLTKSEATSGVSKRNVFQERKKLPFTPVPERVVKGSSWRPKG